MVDVQLDTETEMRDPNGADLVDNGLARHIENANFVSAAFHVEEDGVSNGYYTWHKADGRLPAYLADVMQRANRVVAYNAEFDYIVWNALSGEAPIREDQIDCVAVRSRAMAGVTKPAGKAGKDGGTLSLDQVLEATSAPLRKNKIAKELSGLSFGKKQHQGTLDAILNLAEQRAALDRYMLDDVAPVVWLDHNISQLPQWERENWLCTLRINARGVAVDRAAAIKAAALGKAMISAANAECLAITGLNATQTSKLKEWLEANGILLANMQAETLEAADLAHATPAAKRVLRLRQIVSRNHAAKYQKIVDRCSSDNRLRNTCIHHQARTGRASSVGVNIQNLPRAQELSPVAQDIALRMIAEGAGRDALELMFGPLEIVLADCMRGIFIAPPGKLLASVDYSKAEPVVGTWFTGEQEDPRCYYRMGSAFSGVPQEEIPKNGLIYQAAKIVYLAAGYGQSPKAAYAQLKASGFAVTMEHVDAMFGEFRRLKERTLKFGNIVFRAIGIAVTKQREVLLPQYRHLRIDYCQSDDTARIWLPSGRPIAYRKPLVSVSTTSYGRQRTSIEYDVLGIKRTLHLGVVLENVISATARDVLFDAVTRAEYAGYATVFTVHDEVVAELNEATAVDEAAALTTLLTTPPSWAPDLCMTAEPSLMKRFRKD